MATDNKVRTYDFKKVIITFGAVMFSGFASGSAIKVTQNGDSFEKIKGADGGIDRVNKNSRDYSVSVTLKRTSIVNDLLSAIAIADKETNLGINPLSIKDLNGTSLFFAESAWIKKDPDAEESDALPNRDWIFDTGIATNFVGGSLI